MKTKNNEFQIKLFPTEVHAASCQEILEKSLDLKSETGFVYSNGEPEYKVGIQDINQKGFKYFQINATDFDNFAKIGLTPFPSGLFHFRHFHHIMLSQETQSRGK